MPRSKTRNGPVQRRWNAPRPSTRPEPLLPTLAARDARLRRQILAGTCNPKRPPAPCLLDPVAVARTSSDWAPVLDAYLWAYSADTWEVWHAHVRAKYPLEFWGSPRDSLTAAVEKFHASRLGWMSFDYAKYGRPIAGSCSATAWWLGCGLDPSVRDILTRVYHEDEQRRRRQPMEGSEDHDMFLVDAFADSGDRGKLNTLRYLNTFVRTETGTLAVTEPVPPPAPDPVRVLRAAAEMFGIHFPTRKDEP